MTITNVGPDVATLANYTDTVPVSTTFVSLTSGGWSCTTPTIGGSGAIGCSTATLTSGEVVTLTLVVQFNPNAPAQTLVSHTAGVGSAAIDLNGANNSSSLSTALLPQADLTPEDKDAPSTFRDMLDGAYPRLRRMAPSKPILVLEFGCTAGNPQTAPEDWAQAALEDLFANRWPRVRGVSWWNEHWEIDDNPANDTTMRVQDTPALAQVFSEKAEGEPDAMPMPIPKPGQRPGPGKKGKAEPESKSRRCNCKKWKNYWHGISQKSYLLS